MTAYRPELASPPPNALPVDAEALRLMLIRPSRVAKGRRDGRLRLLSRTDKQLEILAAAVNIGLDAGQSCSAIAMGLPRWADENLVRSLIVETGLERRLIRRGTWAQYHARKSASGEPYTCRRGKGVSYE